jgi:hypothetical protein
MSCQRFQYLLSTSDAPLSPADASFAAAHRTSCPACAQYERAMSGIVSALRTVPEAPTSDAFVASVMAQVRAASPAPDGLWDRLLGTPAHGGRRAYALAGVAAFCLMLLVGGLALRHGIAPYSGHPSPTDGPAARLVSDPPTSGPGFEETEAMLQAQRYVAMAQPLSDDAGVQLVSYTPGDE